MTGQVYDQCEYEGVNYVILGSVGEPLPTATSFNIETADLCTGFHRGYIMYYAIVDNQLLLEKMDVTAWTEPPEINSISPEGYPQHNQYFYTNLNYPVRFTGSIRLGKDLIEEYKSHMGFQPAWSYATVLRLEFTEGEVTASNDQSAENAKQREVKVQKLKAQQKKMRKDAEAYRRRQASPKK